MASAARTIPELGPVSPIVLGAMALDRLKRGAEPTRAQAEVLDAALEAGIDAIDTAPLYGFGASERIVGAWLRRSGAPIRIFTKVGLSWDGPDDRGDVLFETRDDEGRRIVVRKDARPSTILREIEQSSERLGVETLDLVHVHHRDPRVPLDETMSALVDAWRAGQLRAIGVSNHHAADVETAARAVVRFSDGRLRLSAIQDRFNLIHREAEPEKFAVARARGVALLAYSPLAQGLLTGAFGPSRTVQDWRAHLPEFSQRSRRIIDATLARTLIPLGRRYGVTPAAIALVWVLQRDGVTAAIVGARDKKHLDASREALALVERGGLDTRELDALARAFEPLARWTRPSTAARLAERLRRWLARQAC